MNQPKTILITGASSGLGEALAESYAAPGVLLALTGRDRSRLQMVAERCAYRGATVEAATIDVTAADMMSGWIRRLDERRPFDLVIANAGVSAGTGLGGESPEQIQRIFDVNLHGVMNTIQPAIPLMMSRGRGQIAVMSSLASFRGFPGAPAYCASKAAVRVYGEGLRASLKRFGIGVTVVCPGFVATRMTAVNRFRMPFLMQSDDAARIIRSGLARNKGRITFPWPLAMGVWFAQAMPQRLIEWIGERTPAK